MKSFKLPDGSYSLSDIQKYFEYIFKKHETVANNPSIMIHINKAENRITLKIKTGYYLELLTPGTLKLLGSIKSKITKDENGESGPHLEITGVILVHCNIVNNNFESCIHLFLINHLVNYKIFHQKNMFWKTFNSHFSYVEVWFTDQNCKPLEIQDKINITSDQWKCKI